ncbi:hypothetical protein JVT61DRAFT_13271 [Boletus reticuloceps]|uniref:Protein kinase domain-containing protein n=1 Tax=Boletus reticuloceps TaxID=495285 RepID=A0A8I3AB93_9AGAM|nr:hypothetical protein JVT61DRAFT_13271 [Boletus reticuloceps]
MSDAQYVSRPRSDCRNAVPSSSTTKRGHSEVADDGDEGKQSKKRKTGESVVKLEDVHRFVFSPDVVYGHKCLGTLFTASSIRGRGTTVFSVVRNTKRMALRMAWQDDVTLMAEQDAVTKRLKDQGSQLHPNVIVPFMTEKVERGGKVCTTLGAIRGFLDSQIETLGVENRVLTISASDLKRPVKYFWGVHDFVRGLRGALLGHEYLTKIGILHRDISENNIVLGLRPEGERGCLIDFDMAILQNADEPTQPQPQPQPIKPWTRFSTLSTLKSSALPEKAVLTGTFPYISYNVLWGRRHTQFDDVESFLYVLLLFFFSYAGALSVSELRKADEAGFVRSIGPDRPSHMRNWPKEYADWADGQAKQIGNNKYAAVARGAERIIESIEFMDCLQNNWPEELHDPICDLIHASFTIFHRSMAANRSRTEVSHAEFISVLDEWLNLCSHLEDKFSNCPFNQPEAMCETES